MTKTIRETTIEYLKAREQLDAEYAAGGLNKSTHQSRIVELMEALPDPSAVADECEAMAKEANAEADEAKAYVEARRKTA